MVLTMEKKCGMITAVRESVLMWYSGTMEYANVAQSVEQLIRNCQTGLRQN